MAASRDTTAREMMTAAMRDLRLSPSNEVFVERFVLINRTAKTIQSLFADLIANAYITEATFVPNTTGRKNLSSNGAFNATTKVLTITMDTSFASTDVGKAIMLADGTDTYLAFVSAFTSATVVTLTGDNLPSSNLSAVSAILTATTPTADSVSLASLRILRTGPQIKCTLESSSTDMVRNMGLDALRTWSTTSFQNKNSIAWAQAGDTIYLKKGSSVSSYGTLTYKYPRVPVELSTDAGLVDLPDGAAIEIGRLFLKKLIVERTAMDRAQMLPAYASEMGSFVEALYRAFAGVANTEIIKSRIQALS